MVSACALAIRVNISYLSDRLYFFHSTIRAEWVIFVIIIQVVTHIPPPLLIHFRNDIGPLPYPYCLFDCPLPIVRCPPPPYQYQYLNLSNIMSVCNVSCIHLHLLAVQFCLICASVASTTGPFSECCKIVTFVTKTKMACHDI
jgi:hypothetical protein